VSVLDPPFDDDDNDHGEDAFDLDCSYANVESTSLFSYIVLVYFPPFYVVWSFSINMPSYTPLQNSLSVTKYHKGGCLVDIISTNATYLCGFHPTIAIAHPPTCIRIQCEIALLSLHNYTLLLY